MGRAHALVAGLALHLLRQLLQLLDQDAAVGQPERQAGADLVVEDEDLQFLAQLAVVALLGLFQHAASTSAALSCCQAVP